MAVQVRIRELDCHHSQIGVSQGRRANHLAATVRGQCVRVGRASAAVPSPQRVHRCGCQLVRRMPPPPGECSCPEPLSPLAATGATRCSSSKTYRTRSPTLTPHGRCSASRRRRSSRRTPSAAARPCPEASRYLRRLSRRRARPPSWRSSATRSVALLLGATAPSTGMLSTTGGLSARSLSCGPPFRASSPTRRSMRSCSLGA